MAKYKVYWRGYYFGRDIVKDHNKKNKIKNQKK